MEAEAAESIARGDELVLRKVAVVGIPDDGQLAALALDAELVAAAGQGVKGDEGDGWLTGELGKALHLRFSGGSLVAGEGAYAVGTLLNLESVGPCLVSEARASKHKG